MVTTKTKKLVNQGCLIPKPSLQHEAFFIVATVVNHMQNLDVCV